MYMKTLLALLSIASVSLASINPDKTIAPFFKVFGGVEELSDSTYSVEAPYFINDSLNRNGSWQEVSKLTYLRARKLANHVVEAWPRKNRFERRRSFGSAFHVGGNLILTAYHTLDRQFKSTSCTMFKIRLSKGLDRNKISCQEVHHCSAELDYCLLEMRPQDDGFSLKDLTPPVLSVEPQRYSQNAEILAIGNVNGFGLHASLGKGIARINGQYYFYAPVFHGNSGGPIFNEDDEIIGLVTAQSSTLYGSQAVNYATPIDAIKIDLEKNLGVDSPIFQQINFK